MGKGHWPYRVQLEGPFVKANCEEILRWLAVEPIPLTYWPGDPHGGVVRYSFAMEDQAALFHWRFGGKRVDVE